MALDYVTLTVDLFDGSGAYLNGGTASFTPSVQLTDAGSEVVVQAPVQAAFKPTGSPSVKLLATDNAGVTPSGWAWTVTFSGVAGNPASFSFFLPYSGGAAQSLSSLSPASSAVTMIAYVPLGGAVMQGPLAPGASTVTYGASVTPDAALGNLFEVMLTGDVTINAPANPKGDGQVIRLRIRQDATGGHVVTWGSGINFGTSPGVPQLDTAASAKNTVGLEWDAADGEWLGLGAGVY